jgi:hypothetical protein
MNTVTETTPKTVTLRKGDILKQGDEYLDPYSGKWFPTKCVGCEVGLPGKTSMVYRRHVKEGQP